MDYKDTVYIFKEFKEDMCSNILPILLVLLTILVVIIYAFSMVFLSVFMLTFTGLFYVVRLIKNRLFGDGKHEKKYINMKRNI